MSVNSDTSQSILTKCKFCGGGAYHLGTGALFGIVELVLQVVEPKS